MTDPEAIAALVERLRAIKVAADNLLAPVAAETCRLWHDEPNLDVMPYLIAAKTVLPGRLFAALYDLTGDDLDEAAAEIARLREALEEIAQGEGELCAIRDAAGGIEDAMPRMLKADELRRLARTALTRARQG